MKIREVRAIPLAIPMREGSPRSSWTAGTSKQVLVRITTDEGLVGWGEGFAYGAPLAVANVVDEALAPLLVGEDPTRIEHLTTSMHRALMIWGRRGLGMFSVSGVELALWDLAGKARGAPVYTLLGGLAQPRLRAYASLLRYETPADVAAVSAAVAAHGYTAVKLHQTDVASVAAARGAVGDRVDLMLDTNCPGSGASSSGSTCAGWKSRCGRPRTTRGSRECAHGSRCRSPPERTTRPSSATRPSSPQAPSTSCSRASRKWAASAR